MQNEQNNNIFEGLFEEMTPEEDIYQPTDEDLQNYWSGVGNLTIFVTLVIPKEDIFEYDIIEYGGCMGGAQETLGIDYLLRDMWCVDKDPELNLREGFEYKFSDILVAWTRGDGWTTDDDVDYYLGQVHANFRFTTWFKTKMAALWWKHIGWRIHK